MLQKKLEDNHSLSYFITGKGNQPIILIHGFGEDSRIWKHQISYLENDFRLLVPDLPGTGQSPIGNRELSMESMAETTKQMLDEEKIDQCIMVGHSMGGYVTLAFAELYPERLTAFGLIHSTAYADSDEKKAARQKSITFIKEHGAAEFMKTTIPNLFSQSFNSEHKEQVDELIEQGNQFTAEALIAYYTAMINRPNRSHILQKTTVPVLFFIGEEDKAVNPADALAQTALPTVCMAKLILGIAHMGMLEATTELNLTIGEFCTTVQDLTTVTT
ncbi:alpha/beta hydrolase [Lacibacter sp. H375]|uniref:alpha/beta fold hydrolase n=1 Tax=Lacibacter sp. H375 TaxID=3133424 RepID=UPI0030C486F1